MITVGTGGRSWCVCKLKMLFYHPRTPAFASWLESAREEAIVIVSRKSPLQTAVDQRQLFAEVREVTRV